MQVWVDGQLVDAAAAHVSPLDAGWRLGDGVFSTLLAHDGRPQRLAAHVERTLRDAATLGLHGLDAAQLAAATRQVAEGNATDHPRLVLRLVVTRGAPPPEAPFGAAASRPTMAVLAAPTPRSSPATTAAVVEGGRRPAAIKSTSWAWSSRAIAAARARGAGTALLVEGQDLLEGAAANVVVALDGVGVTPPDDGRLLPGTTRALLLATGAVQEAPVTITQLATAREVVLVSAVRGAVAVTAVDGTPVGDGRADGVLVRRLREVLVEAGVGPEATHGR